MTNKFKTRQFVGKVLILLALVSLTAATFMPSPLLQSEQEITRAETLAIADNFANYTWTGTLNNVFHPNLSYENRYTLDPNGGAHPIEPALASFIDTPDLETPEGQANFGWWQYQSNQGVPYAWGGSTTIDPINLPTNASGGQSFGDRIARGFPGGDTTTPANEFETFYTNGVDCVGLINNAWRMGSRKGMRDLHDVYSRPIKFKELRAGDILMYQADHVMLFESFLNYDPASGDPVPGTTQFRVYEAAKSDAKVVHRDYKLISLDHPVGTDENNWRGNTYETDQVTIQRLDSGITLDGYYIPRTYFNPIDVVLVIDDSGSMSTEYRILAAKAAAKMFVDFMRTGDKIGVVAFNSVAEVKYPLTTIDTEAVKTAAKNSIDTLTAGGGTSIGGGLFVGGDQLVNRGTSTGQPDGQPDPIRLEILLSDGSENAAPFYSQVTGALTNANIAVHTLGLGSDADQALLQTIATEHKGVYRFANVKGLTEAFNSIFSKVYGDNLVETSSGMVSSGSTVVESMLVDSTIGSITFSLAWPGSDLDLTLVQPDGREINPTVANSDPNITFTSGSTYEFYKIFAPQPGAWTLRVFGKSTSGAQEEYTVSASASDAMILSVDFDKTEYFSGDQIRFTASIEDSVSAADFGPEYILGTTMQVTAEDPNHNIYSFELYDDGLNGDGAANDGIYSTTFNNTGLEGSYNFKVKFSGENNRDGQPFTREYALSTVVKASPLPLACTPSNIYGQSQPGFQFASYNKASLPASFDRLPLAFVPNRGQEDQAVRFQVRGLGGKLFFASSEVVFSLPNPVKVKEDKKDEIRYDLHPANVVRIHYQGANDNPDIAGTGELPGVVNTLKGNDSSKWQTNLPTYSGITYSELYPGIQLRYEGMDGNLKSTFTAAPGADPSAIIWRYKGASDVNIDESGNLVISLPEPAGIGAVLVEEAPIAWQEAGEDRIMIAVKYSVDKQDKKVSFVFPNGYDPTLPLVIDPTLTYSTYLGGGTTDEGDAITLDADCNMYLTGVTYSTNFPTETPIQTNQPGSDVFVSKLNPAGDTVLYSTYIGGGGSDHAWGVNLDSQGRITIVGETESNNFPILNAFDTTQAGGTCSDGPCDDVFVTQLLADGSALRYSTYLGGNKDDESYSMTLGPDDMVYLTGLTKSSTFPTTANGYDRTFGGGTCSGYPCEDVFVSRVNTALAGTNSLVYSTFLGGSNYDKGRGIALDASGRVYVAGFTRSDNYPTLNPYQAARVGDSDIFVTKLDMTLSGVASLLYSTYLGGSGSDHAYGLALNGANQVYLTGFTQSTNFPLANPFHNTFGGGTCRGSACYDAYVTHLDIGSNSLVSSSYLGGSNEEQGAGITVDDNGNAYVTGYTKSTNFTTLAAIQPAKGADSCSTPPCADAFVTNVSAAGSLVYSTYLGGSMEDYGNGIVLDGLGTAYIIGHTFSSIFPGAINPFTGTAGYADAFVVKIDD